MDSEEQKNQQQLKQPLNPQEQDIDEPQLDKRGSSINIKRTGTVCNNINHSFYFFVNPFSGSNDGKYMIQLQPNYREFKVQNKFNKKSDNNNSDIKEYDVYCHFINLANQDSQKEGTDHIKKTISEGTRQVYAITCGGDGTVSWVSEVMDKFQIDLDDVPIGIIALGTGNDFSRALGWGGTHDIPTLLKNDFKELKAFILQWIQSNVADFDLWDARIETFDEGHFSVIKKENGKVVEKILEDPETHKPLKTLDKTFLNYFSQGTDAAIGFDFDKRRTKSRCCNLCVYSIESVKRLFKGPVKVNQNIKTLDQMKSSEPQSSQDYLSQRDAETRGGSKEFNQSQISQNMGQVMFENKENEEYENIFKARTKESFRRDKDELKQLKKQDQKLYDEKLNESNRFLKGDPTCILFLNINSYAGGASQMWNNATVEGGITNINGKEKMNYTPKNDQTYQQFWDGKIEVLSYDNILDLGLEKLKGGNGKRIAQGAGPYRFTFREKNKKGEKICSYFQIDGEYFMVSSPKIMQVTKSKKFNTGKYKVLIENKKYKEYLHLKK